LFYTAKGCDGGMSKTTIQDMSEVGGFMLEKDYPYKAVDVSSLIK
jgi:hypothetical protein